jgi:hypothetical protein
MSISKRRRFQIFSRDKFTCRYCGRNSETVTLEVDHAIPKSNGGTDDEANLVTACFDCNRGKSNLPVNSGSVDYLAMAQELREQEAFAAILKERERKEAANLKRFSAKIRKITKVHPGGKFDRGTLMVLYSYTREFGESVVCRWVEKAFVATRGASDQAIGKYVSGIRRIEKGVAK